eukprot:762514-Hanusia_phi.AAC.14
MSKTKAEGQQDGSDVHGAIVDKTLIQYLNEKWRDENLRMLQELGDIDKKNVQKMDDIIEKYMMP